MHMGTENGWIRVSNGNIQSDTKHRDILSAFIVNKTKERINTNQEKKHVCEFCLQLIASCAERIFSASASEMVTENSSSRDIPTCRMTCIELNSIKS